MRLVCVKLKKIKKRDGQIIRKKFYGPLQVKNEQVVQTQTAQMLPFTKND
mgnify:CR=1 FL=1